MACLQKFSQYYAPAALKSWHKTLIYETFWFVLEICKTINDIFHLELLRETEINRQDGDISKHGTDEFAGTVFEKVFVSTLVDQKQFSHPSWWIFFSFYVSLKPW